MGLKIGLRESINHMGQRIVNGLGSTIPEGDRLQIVLERTAAEVDAKRSRYQEALKQTILLQDPDDAKKGELPALHARISRLEAQGRKWGKVHSVTENEDEHTELETKMQECAIEILALKEQATSLEVTLQMWQETVTLRREAWQNAKAEYDQLRLQGKALVAQKAALFGATQEHTRALQETSSAKNTSTKSILAGLRRDLKEAQADNQAAKVICAGGKRTSIEEELDMENRARIAQEIVSRWTKV